MKPWWNRGERLRWELSQLSEAGFSYDAPYDLDVPGVIKIDVRATIEDEGVPLKVSFPELYPYVRFVAEAPELKLAHHQNPFLKNLCLLGRRTTYWSTEDSVANVLKQQLPRVLRTGRSTSTAEVEGLEEMQAEPISEYYPYRPEAMILVDSSWQLPAAFSTGTITIGCHHTKPGRPLKGAVLEIRNLDGKLLVSAPTHLQEYFPKRLKGDIIKRDEPLAVPNAAEFQDQARSEASRTRKPNDVLALIFPEEHAWRTAGQGWIFVVGNRKASQYYFARAGYIGEDDLAARTPELRNLSKKSVAVFGLGCIGSASAVELAKAGVGDLRILDHDYVDPGTVRRWQLGLAAVGNEKARVIGEYIQQHYPMTSVTWKHARLGDHGNDLDVLGTMTDNVDFIYDATTEEGISYVLAELARRTGIPYISATGTQGGWGGEVTRLTPETGCWHCLKSAQMEKKVPEPPEDKTGTVQPVGCGDPTFTGSGFDLSSVALMGVRTAIATMLADEENAYPQMQWDVQIIAFRDENGQLILPKVQGFTIPPRTDCPVCGSA